MNVLVCRRCGYEVKEPNTNICGNCADQLRDEEDTEMNAAIAENEINDREKANNTIPY